MSLEWEMNLVLLLPTAASKSYYRFTLVEKHKAAASSFRYRFNTAYARRELVSGIYRYS